MPAGRVRITPTPETRAALDRLAHMDVDRELRREINAATQSVVADIRRDILSMPSSTGHKTRGRAREGLRVAIARNVKKHVHLSPRRTSIEIVLEGHGGPENIGRAVDGEIDWHHPTFGHNPDVTEQPHPFFYKIIARAIAPLEYRIRAAVDRALARANGAAL